MSKSTNVLTTDPEIFKLDDINNSPDPERCSSKHQGKKLLRKIDRHLMIPLWILFLFGFLDRINLGNVNVLGIANDLNMSGTDMAVAMQVFFVPYILFDVPSNIVMKKCFPPSVWISLSSSLWGITCMCQGFVRNSSGLIACRFFMGIFEAGFVPGCTYLMAMFYLRHEYQTRFSLFWVAGLVAGAFGGLLAYALNHMDGLRGYEGWRWIFIIEGLLSVVVAVPARFILADWPDQASFLTAEEKLLLHDRISRDLGGCSSTTTTTTTTSSTSTGIAAMNRLDSDAWSRILTDWKVFVGSLLYLGVTVSGYATALFIPTIVNSLGYDGVESQIHSIPVWAVAAVVTLTISVLADRLKHRYGFIVVGVVISCIGYLILLCQPSSSSSAHQHPNLSIGIRYMAVFFVTTGTYIVQPISLVWLANNLGGHYKRAIGLALQVGFGNIGGIIASNVFNARFSPSFTAGYAVSLALMLFCGVMSSVFAVGLVRENRFRKRGGRDYRFLVVEDGVTVLGNDNLGDDDPRFRFTL